MRILVVTNMYPSRKYPHYGVFVRNTADILKQSGHDVTICSMGKSENKITKLFAYMKLYVKSIGLGAFGKYDVVYAHFISHTALPVKIIKHVRPNIKVILNAHGNDVVGDTVQDQKNVQRSKSVVPYADGVIVPSNYYRDVICGEFGVPEEKIKVFPSGGVDAKKFRRLEKEEARKKCSLNKDSFYIGYISRIEEGKGWDVFLKATSKLIKNHCVPNLRFLVVGDGAQKNDMLAMVDQLEMNSYIDFVPLVSQEDLVFYYNSLDVFCFSTRRKSESLGLVGLEAMACQVPCVISSVPGTLSYAINEKNCLTFNPEDDEELVNKILKIMKMDDKQKSDMLNHQKETVKKFEKDSVKSQFILDFCGFLKDKTYNGFK